MIDDIKLVPAPEGHSGPVLIDENMKPYCLKILVNGEWTAVRKEEE